MFLDMTKTMIFILWLSLSDIYFYLYDDIFWRLISDIMIMLYWYSVSTIRFRFRLSFSLIYIRYRLIQLFDSSNTLTLYNNYIYIYEYIDNMIYSYWYSNIWIISEYPQLIYEYYNINILYIYIYEIDICIYISI